MLQSIHAIKCFKSSQLKLKLKLKKSPSFSHPAESLVIFRFLLLLLFLQFHFMHRLASLRLHWQPRESHVHQLQLRLEYHWLTWHRLVDICILAGSYVHTARTRWWQPRLSSSAAAAWAWNVTFLTREADAMCCGSLWIRSSFSRAVGDITSNCSWQTLIVGREK